MSERSDTEMKQIDILIKNGTVIDPPRNINKKGNIGIVEGKLIEIGNEEYRLVENETLLTFFLIDELINISYNMANIY